MVFVVFFHLSARALESPATSPLACVGIGGLQLAQFTRYTRPLRGAVGIQQGVPLCWCVCCRGRCVERVCTHGA